MPTLYAKTRVTLHLPDSPHPPREVALDELRAGLLSRGIPSSALVQTGPGQPWRTAEDVVADCINFQPIRAWLTIAILILLPFVLFCIHATLLGWSASNGFLLLTGAGAIGAAFVSATPWLRTLTDVELTKSMLLRGIVIAAFVFAEGAAVAVVVPEGFAQRRIVVALSTADPCVTPSAADMEAYGTDEKRAQVQSRKIACAEQTYHAHCNAVAAHLDAKKVAEEDFAFIATQGASGTWAKDLVQRLGAGKFSAADLHTSEADLPCGDKIWSRVVKAAATTSAAWSLNAGGTSLSISDDMKMALAQAHAESPGSLPKTALSPDVQRAIQVDEDTLAQPALTKTRTDDMAIAQSFCELGNTLRVVPTASCIALGKRYAQAKAREDAIAAREQAVAKAKADREAAVAAGEQAAQDKRDEADRNRQGAGLFSCTTACYRNRPEEERQVANELAGECNERCGNDWSCTMTCERIEPTTCLDRCARRYPSAVDQVLRENGL